MLRENPISVISNPLSVPGLCLSRSGHKRPLYLLFSRPKRTVDTVSIRTQDTVPPCTGPTVIFGPTFCVKTKVSKSLGQANRCCKVSKTLTGPLCRANRYYIIRHYCLAQHYCLTHYFPTEISHCSHFSNLL